MSDAARQCISALLEDILKACLDRAPYGVHWVGPDGTILWANQTELDYLGYRQDDFVGHYVAEFHVDREVSDDLLGRLVGGEPVIGYHTRLRHRDGSIRSVTINSNSRWEDSTTRHTQCFVRMLAVEHLEQPTSS